MIYHFYFSELNMLGTERIWINAGMRRFRWRMLNYITYWYDALFVICCLITNRLWNSCVKRCAKFLQN